MPRPGAYFGKRLQEHLLHRACGHDARVAGLEASYVHLALYLSRQPRFEPAVEEPVQALPTAGAAAPLEPPELPSGEAGNEPGRADGHLPPRTWRQLDDLDLAAELRKPVRTVRDSPRWFRASLLSAYGIALREWDRTPTPTTWKLVLLVPRMLLQHTEEKGQAGKTAFSDRFKRFCRGEWIALLVEAAASNRQRQGATKTLDSEALAAQRGSQAEAKVSLREVTRARVQLTSLGLAAGTKATLDELTNPDLRPPRPTAPIPAQLLEQLPAEPLKLDSSKVLEALRSAGRGSAQDLSGTRYEHLRVLLEDEELWNVLVRFLQAFARAKVPEDV